MKIKSFALAVAVLFAVGSASALPIDILITTDCNDGVTVSDGHIIGTGEIVGDQLVSFVGTNTGIRTVDMTAGGFGPVEIQSNTSVSGGGTSFHEVGTETCTSTVAFWCQVAGYSGVGAPQAVNITYDSVTYSFVGGDPLVSTPCVVSSDSNCTSSWTITVIPEPGTALLLGAGLVGLAYSRLRHS